MGSSSKRQTTMAKIARERALQEKRERKQQKKDARKQAAADERAGLTGEAGETRARARARPQSPTCLPRNKRPPRRSMLAARPVGHLLPLYGADRARLDLHG